MTKLVGIAALLALAVFGAGCTESVEAEEEGEEVVATADAELRAKALAPEALLAKLKPSKEVQTVKARFSLPAWQGYGDNPQAIRCQWSAQQFDMRIQLKVTGGGVLVQTIRITYDTSMAPQALYVSDSVTKEKFTKSLPEFVYDGSLGVRGPGNFDRMVVNKTFKPQSNNGEGISVDFDIVDSLLDTGHMECSRRVYVAFKVKK